MKKILAGILAFALSMSLIGCNNDKPENLPEETTASAAETPAPETTTTAEETPAPETTTTEATTPAPETTTEAITDVPETTTAVVSDPKNSDNKAVADDFITTLISAKYTLSCSATEDGVTADMIMSVDLKSNAMHIAASSDGQKFSMLMNNDGFFMLDDTNKQYLAFPMGADNPMSDLEFANDAAAVSTMNAKTGKDTLNGKECEYVEYTGDSDASIRIYVENGKVIAMENVENPTSRQLIIVKSVSKTVDASLFKLPAGYTEMKLDF